MITHTHRRSHQVYKNSNLSGNSSFWNWLILWNFCGFPRIYDLYFHDSIPFYCCVICSAWSSSSEFSNFWDMIFRVLYINWKIWFKKELIITIIYYYYLDHFTYVKTKPKNCVDNFRIYKQIHTRVIVYFLGCVIENINTFHL